MIEKLTERDNFILSWWCWCWFW